MKTNVSLACSLYQSAVAQWLRRPIIYGCIFLFIYFFFFFKYVFCSFFFTSSLNVSSSNFILYNSAFKSMTIELCPSVMHFVDNECVLTGIFFFSLFATFFLISWCQSVMCWYICVIKFSFSSMLNFSSRWKLSFKHWKFFISSSHFVFFQFFVWHFRLF